jgi:hypothetical protein
MMWRHGDVMIAAVTSIPFNAKRRNDGILAHGENTGHSHRIEEMATAELWESKGELFLKVIGDGARIVHEEHKPIELPQGVYRVWKQREYSPEKIRPVSD